MKTLTRSSELLSVFIGHLSATEREPNFHPDEIGSNSEQRRHGELETVLKKPNSKALAKGGRFGQETKRQDNRAVAGRRQKSKKNGKKKGQIPPFRNSGLDLQSPRASPQPRPPSWI